MAYKVYEWILIYTTYLFSHFIWFYFLWLLKNEVEKNPCKLLEKQISDYEEKIIFFCFLKGVFELLYLNEWDGRVTVTSADIIADNTKTNFMKKTNFVKPNVIERKEDEKKPTTTTVNYYIGV